MKIELRFKFLFYVFFLLKPFNLTSSPLLSSAIIVRVGNNCSGYLFPETNYVWTLSQCLEYENAHGIISIKSKITIQKNQYPLSSSIIHNSKIDIDTLKNPKIIYKGKDWVLLSVDLPVNLQVNKTHYSTELPSIIDTFSIGYPVVTEYKADAIRNYVDWLLLPQWQYQVDTFMKRIQSIENQLIKPTLLKDLIAHGKRYMTDIRKSDADVLKTYTLHKAIEFCIKKWTDNQFILNRLATLSNFEKSPERDKIISDLNLKMNKTNEIDGLATRLFITYSILPIDIMPETGSELILTFQKDYYACARFLFDHPETLNKINLSIRNIQSVAPTKPSNYPVWNQQDTVLDGNGRLQIIQKIRDSYWKVSGMSGAPLFFEGRLIGIQSYLPYYTSRELTYEKGLNFVSIHELKHLQYLEEPVGIWNKISGIIGQ